MAPNQRGNHANPEISIAVLRRQEDIPATTTTDLTPVTGTLPAELPTTSAATDQPTSSTTLVAGTTTTDPSIQATDGIVTVFTTMPLPNPEATQAPGEAIASTPSGRSLSPPAMAGLIVGCIGGVALVLLLALLYRVWQKHKQSDDRPSEMTEIARRRHTGIQPVMAHVPRSGQQRATRKQGRTRWLPEDASQWLNKRLSQTLTEASARSNAR